MNLNERRQLWQRFSNASVDLLEHPLTTVKLGEAVMNALDEMLPPEEAIENYRRRLPLMADLFTPEESEAPMTATASQSERPRQFEFEDLCQEFGDSLKDILKDEATGNHVREAASRLVSQIDTWAERVDPVERAGVYAQFVLANAMIIVNDEDDESESEPEAASAGA